MSNFVHTWHCNVTGKRGWWEVVEDDLDPESKAAIEEAIKKAKERGSSDDR